MPTTRRSPSSYNEARLTPRGDSRQNGDPEPGRNRSPRRGPTATPTTGAPPSPRSICTRRTRNWRSPGLSVVETEPFWRAARRRWTGTSCAPNRSPTGSTNCSPPPHSCRADRKLDAIAEDLRKGGTPDEAVVAPAAGCTRRWTTSRARRRSTRPQCTPSSRPAGRLPGLRASDAALLRSMGIPSRYVSGYLHPKPEGRDRRHGRRGEPRVDRGVDRCVGGDTTRRTRST